MHTKILLSALLASVALPAFAADMPLKAPRPAEAIYNDWSGIYTGVAAGFAWGREKLSNDLTTFDDGVNSSLFGTGTPRIFNGNPVLIQPAFFLNDCVIPNCNKVKMNGFMAGGFAGAQKQLGNWVIGIEGSWDWTGMKKSHSATEVENDPNVVRFLPTTTFAIPAQTVTVPGQTAPVTVTTNPTGVQVISALFNTGLPQGTVIPAGTGFPVILSSGNQGGPQPPTGALGPQVVTLTTDHPITVGANGTVVLQQNLAGTFTVNGQVIAASVIATTAGTGQGTATIAPTPITIPAQNITLALPQATTVRALVTRSVDVESKIDQIADIRGKFGLTNVFFGPNVLIYATGGAAIGHFQKSLNISQSTQVCANAACTAFIGTARTDAFSATSGDTRLGWVVGAGLDWKLTPNLILGALYRHHEFPKGTVSFSEGTNSLGFGTSRATVDSIQGRLSVLFPIQ
jgi:opacity protein-like surface antigen